MDFKFKTSLLLLSLALATAAVAQQVATSRELVYEQKEQWFDKSVGSENTNLINGPEYFIAFQGGPTNPFFGTLALATGELWYNQQYYPNVELLYDIYLDMVVLRHRDEKGFFTMITLDQDKIERFNLQQHHFKKMKNPKPPGKFAGNGYYDILFTGRHVTLAVKRMKLERQAESQVEYQKEDRYYFIRDNQWMPVSGLESIIGLMKVHSDKIKDFASSSRIKIRKKNESDLKVIARFCETLLTADASK